MNQKQAIALLKVGIGKSKSLPILENVLVTKESIRVTNLEFEISIPNTFNIEPGLYFIAGDSFIKSNDNEADFPSTLKVVEPHKTQFTNCNLIAEKFIEASHFVGNDSMRPAMEGVCFDFRKSGFNIVSTNALMMYKFIVDNKASEHGTVIFPAKQLASSFSKLKNQNFYLLHSKTHACFVFENGIKITLMIIDQIFPDYNAVIPKDKTYFEINTNSIDKAAQLYKKYKSLPGANIIGSPIYTIINKEKNSFDAKFLLKELDINLSEKIADIEFLTAKSQFAGSCLLLMPVMSESEENIYFYSRYFDTFTKVLPKNTNTKIFYSTKTRAICIELPKASNSQSATKKSAPVKKSTPTKKSAPVAPPAPVAKVNTDELDKLKAKNEALQAENKALQAENKALKAVPAPTKAAQPTSNKNTIVRDGKFYKIPKILDTVYNFGKAEQYINYEADFINFVERSFNVSEIKLTSPQAIVDTYNLKGLVFGNFVTQEERFFFLYKISKQLEVLSKIKGSQNLGNGELVLAFGSEGRPNTMAHFNPNKLLINLNRGGKGDYSTILQGESSFIHEYAHYLDFRQGNMNDKGLPFNFASENNKETHSNKITALFSQVTLVPYNDVDYYKKLHTDYYQKKIEIFARLFEAALTHYINENESEYNLFFDRKYKEAIYYPKNLILSLGLDKKIVQIIKQS